MKNILIIFIVITFLFSMSCNKCGGKATVVDTGVEITYVNNKGEDLLNVATPGHFSADSIHIYNVVKGIKKEVYNSHYDIPRNFVIIKNDSLHKYFLRIFPDVDTTLLELNENTTDTITCEFAKSYCNNQIVTKVWYNGILKWGDMSVPRAFTIIK